MFILFTTTIIIVCALLGAWYGRKLSQKNIGLSSLTTLEENVKSILSSAQLQREIILQEAQLATKEQQEAELKRIEDEKKLIVRINEKIDTELNLKQSELDKLENTLNKRELSFHDKNDSLAELQTQYQEYSEKQSSLQSDYSLRLEQKSGLQKIMLADSMKHELIAAESLGIQKWLMDNNDFLKQEGHNFATKALQSIYYRYQPSFVWPKSSFVVQVNEKELLSKYFEEGSPIIAALIDGTDTSLSILNVNEEMPPLLKITGGAGVDKEIIRLTLEEILPKKQFDLDKIYSCRKKHKSHLDKLVLKMGHDAVKILGFDEPLHPEILKLIGSLNYRTSHRQNQYFHSLEVACLAGMIANEIGVDPKITKRAGILHDIGKVLDYKIEGSHAVISADYAGRYGENETVVDTVLAHHDDKIVETPYAYILKAADALSGARPGARVDMEEGYNRRIDGISGVLGSFQDRGVTGSAIMHAGREVHIFVDSHKVKNQEITELAQDIAQKLEQEVEYPGQIKVTVIRRTEITEVA